MKNSLHKYVPESAAVEDNAVMTK